VLSHSDPERIACLANPGPGVCLANSLPRIRLKKKPLPVSPRAPWGTATEFVAEAIRHNLLIIPGNVFSRRDTHFRISYAVDDATLARGLTVLRELARRGA